MHFKFNRGYLTLFCLLMVPTSYAQDQGHRWFSETPRPLGTQPDSIYIVSFTENLTTRLYSSVKYTSFRIVDNEEHQSLSYLTNRNFILGIGATYSWFSLNIGLNFPFVNKDNDVYGSTKYLDLQTHMHFRKFNADLYLQSYNGYYLANSGNMIKDWPQTGTFQSRPDIKTINIGYNFQYILNNRKFSLRAIYYQNEWQKKSAGSWILGTNFFYCINRSDSASLIPENLANPDFLYGASYKRQDVLNVGINGGYYYTLVIARHVFFSIGVTAGPGIGSSWFDINDKSVISRSGGKLVFTGMFRSSLGYNSERIFIGTFFLNQAVLNPLPEKYSWNYLNMGNCRILLVYRFKLHKPIKMANPRYWNFLYKKGN